MRPLVANWLTLVQCPAIWLWHLMGILFFIGFSGETEEAYTADGAYFGSYLIVIFTLSISPATLMKETISKSFTFCLPNHLKFARLVIIGSGVLLSLLTSLVFLICPADTALEKFGIVFSAASASMCVYLVSAYIIFRFRNTSGSWGVHVAVLFVSSKYFPELLRALHELTCHHPIRNGVLALACTMVAWQRLGRRDLMRSLSGGLFLPLHQSWSKARAVAYGKQARAQKMSRASKFPWGAIERGFFSGMIRRPLLSRARFVMGRRLVVAGWIRPLTLTGPIALVLGLLGCVVVGGFIPPHSSEYGISDANVLYFVISTLGITVPVPIFSHLLLPGGRKDRFWTSMYIAGASALFGLVVSVALYAFSLLVEAVSPEIVLNGITYPFYPMDMKLFFPAFLMLPVLFTLQFLCPVHTTIVQTIVLIVGLCLHLLLYEACYLMNPIAVVVLLVVFWGGFIHITHWVYKNSDLVLQR